MRKLAIGLFLASTAFAVTAQTPMVATDISAAQVRAFLKDAPAGQNSDHPIRIVDGGGYMVGVYGAIRRKDSPPGASLHQTHATEIYYILEGAGVLKTGGALSKPVTSHPSAIGNWTDLGSAGIDGGVSRRVAKGDMVIIPGGTPHMWVSLEHDITYLIVRPDPGNALKRE